MVRERKQLACQGNSSIEE